MKHYILCGSEAIKALNLNEIDRVKYLLENHQAKITTFRFDIVTTGIETTYLNLFLQELNEFDEFYLLTESDYYQITK